VHAPPEQKVPPSQTTFAQGEPGKQPTTQRPSTQVWPAAHTPASPEQGSARATQVGWHSCPAGQVSDLQLLTAQRPPTQA
jgi:hypothetical protein